MGAFVINAASPWKADAVATLLTGARDSLTTAITTINTLHDRRITIDFDRDDEDTYFVLTSALQEWASAQKARADHGKPVMRDQVLHWASLAEDLAERVETQIRRPRTLPIP